MYKPKHSEHKKLKFYSYYDIITLISKLLININSDYYYLLDDGILDDFVEYLNENKHPVNNYEKHED